MNKLRGVMMQFFHWDYPNSGTLWDELKNNTKKIAKSGFTALWLPPAYKGWGGINDVGYGTYDLYDLGEFNQKGTVRTKYGTKKQYLEAIKAAREEGINIYVDVVFNHKMGADRTEKVKSVPINPYNRNIEIGHHTEKEHWTAFDFPGRKGKYSKLKWNSKHFDAVKEYGTIYKIKDKSFDIHVDSQYGNYDFLMGCDIDMNSDEAKQDLHNWAEWMYDTAEIDGFRIDAIKHIRSFFFKGWLDNIRKYSEKNLFAVGEYWSADINKLRRYIHETEGKMALFDVPLHYNFHIASKVGRDYDMGSIMSNSVVNENPVLAVTFVDNHDSQPLQSLESFVEDWFKPIAYSIILLRDTGYPCVFYPDYYGAEYTGYKNNNEYKIKINSHKKLIDIFIKVRKKYTFGKRNDYFDHRNIIGWTFEGDKKHKSSAIVMSNNEITRKWMKTGKAHVKYYDITKNIETEVKSNEYGWAEFICKPGKVSVWLEV